jgi:hypothetical protein
MSDDNETNLRTYMLGIHLRDEERDAIDRDARSQRITRSEAVRRACPKYFSETGITRGRRAGISPWKLNQS